jgi:ABC-type transport system involved in multi-copper enzyme maturation permease subunit
VSTSDLYRYRALFYSLVVLVYVLLIPTSIARAIYHRSKRVSAVYNAFCIFLFCIFIAITTLFGFKLVKQIEDSPRLQKLKNFLKKVRLITTLTLTLFRSRGTWLSSASSSSYSSSRWESIHFTVKTSGITSHCIGSSGVSHRAMHPIVDHHQRKSMLSVSPSSISSLARDQS